MPTPAEQLASGQISPAQYVDLQRQAISGSMAGAGLRLPPPQAPGMPPPPPIAPSFDPSAPPVVHKLDAMPSTTGAEVGSTVPNPKYTSPIAQAQASAKSQGVDADSSAFKAPGPAFPQRLIVSSAGAPAAPSTGAAQMQGAPPDPLASVLRPGGMGAAHAVGYSPADKNRIGQLGQEEKQQQTDAAAITNHVGQIADTFAKANDTLAADTQIGLQKYQQQLADNAQVRTQLQADAKQSQSRIEAQLADMQANGVDPNRYFQNQTTGQKIIGALAVGLGTFGAHALGPNGHESTNTALEMMNNAIARDVDAQKTNLAKSIDLTKFGASVDATGFDHQKALLEAERDSIQSAYAVAMNETAKRAAMFRDNADVQTKAAQITAGLQEAAQARVDQKNDQIYGMQKRAEQVVGGSASNEAEKIRALTEDYRKIALANGKNPTAAELHEMVVKDRYGVAGGESNVDISAPPKGAAANAGKLSPRLAAKAAMLDAHAGEAEELDKLMNKGSSLSPSDRARAEALAEGLRNDGYKSVPEEPLKVWSNTGAHRAGLEEVRKSIARQKASLLKYGTGGAADESDQGDNPAGLEKDE